MFAQTSTNPQWDIVLGACQKNDVQKIQTLLDMGCPPSHPNGVGQTGLHIASMWGNVEAVELLINAGADVNAQNVIAQMAPLHSAVRGTFQSFAQTHTRRLECIRMLLEANADVTLKDSKGCDPFQSIGEFSSLDNIWGLAFITHLADDVIKESDERNLGDIEAEMAEMKKIFLLYSGISVSPLQQSVENNDVEGVNKALADTANPVSQEEKNEMLLKAVDKIEYLLDNQIDEKWRFDLYGDMVTTLLQNGANPDSFLTPNESPQPLAEAPLHILCKSLTSSPPLPSGAEMDCFTKVKERFWQFGCKQPSFHT